ncbi:MAG: 50S ribosomal protein L6 [Bacilli bacterium]|jgi:large subunit ribosomal protein L6|nr:50S ribosomal protein L6 [Bacilli bacterium]MDY0399339.1 50S ribosomal protein L6 [Bacilli bacterium]
MSRIGNKVIEIPSGVTLALEHNVATVKGPKGELKVALPKGITVEQDEHNITVKRTNNEIQQRENHGTTRALLHNAIVGVSQGFSKKLELVGIGFKATQKGNAVLLDLGYSHSTTIEPEANATIVVKSTTEIIVEGIDRQAVGQTAANIRALRKPEPYLGKGVKYSGEKILRREGKRAGKK